MKRITEEKKQEIRRVLETSATGYETAEKCGVSISTVNKVRKELEREGFDIWHKGGLVSSWIK